MTLACSASLAERAEPLTTESLKEGKGVVLMDINWSRKWKCGGFQNAQVRSISFDRIPVDKTSDDAPADLSIEDSAPVVGTGFTTYAFVLDPGEYALTQMKIKVARSTSDVAYRSANRSRLLKDGQPLAGSFDVKPGETVYIGHFFLDCAREPVLWRYYPADRKAFEEYVLAAREKYPSLDPAKTVFRLFKTTVLGEPFELPQ